MDFFPTVIIPFLKVFRSEFNKTGFQCFLGFWWGFVCTPGKKTLTRIASCSPKILRHPSSWSRFLAYGKWDLWGLQKRMGRFIWEYLFGQIFYMGYLVAAIDTTLIPVFGKKVMGCQVWHDHSGNTNRGGALRGHQWGVVGLLIRGEQWLCLPICARLFSGKKNPGFIAKEEGVAIASFWDQALGLCRCLKRIVCWPLIIVADAYFSKDPFINGLACEGIILISRLRNDAKGWKKETPQPTNRRGRPRKRGREVRIRDLLGRLPLQEAWVERYGKMERVCFVSQTLCLRNISHPVLVVVIKTKAEPLILVCTSLKLRPVEAIELYAARFSIETALQTMKGKLGMMDYQFVTPVSVYRYVNLACLSMCFWRAVSLIIPVDSWIKDFHRKPYLVQTDTSFGLIFQALRQFAIRKIIFDKFPKRRDLQKIRNTYSAIERLAA